MWGCNFILEKELHKIIPCVTNTAKKLAHSPISFQLWVVFLTLISSDNGRPERYNEIKYWDDLHISCVLVVKKW